MHLKPKKGFTLIEMLIVLAIIAMLVSIVIVAINPGRHFQQARDTQRWTGVNAILSAVHQNIIDNNGIWTCAAGDLPGAATKMADPTTDPTGYDICDCIVPTYIGSLPCDPSTGNYVGCTFIGGGYETMYEISQDAVNDRVTVSATGELTGTISVTR